MVTLGRRHGSSRLIHPLVSTRCGGAGLNAVALCKLLGYYWTSESWGCPKISLLANRVWGCLSIQVQKSGDITVFMLWTCGTGHTSSVCVCVCLCVCCGIQWRCYNALDTPYHHRLNTFPLKWSCLVTEIRATTLIMEKVLMTGRILGDCAEHSLVKALGKALKPLGKHRVVGRIFRKEEKTRTAKSGRRCSFTLNLQGNIWRVVRILTQSLNF